MIPSFKCATAVTALDLSTEIQTASQPRAKLIWRANVPSRHIVPLALRRRLLIGIFASKFILILRQELRLLARIQEQMSTVR